MEKDFHVKFEEPNQQPQQQTYAPKLRQKGKEEMRRKEQMQQQEQTEPEEDFEQDNYGPAQTAFNPNATETTPQPTTKEALKIIVNNVKTKTADVIAKNKKWAVGLAAAVAMIGSVMNVRAVQEERANNQIQVSMQEHNQNIRFEIQQKLRDGSEITFTPQTTFANGDNRQVVNNGEIVRDAIMFELTNMNNLVDQTQIPSLQVQATMLENGIRALQNNTLGTLRDVEILNRLLDNVNQSISISQNINNVQAPQVTSYESGGMQGWTPQSAIGQVELPNYDELSRIAEEFSVRMDHLRANFDITEIRKVNAHNNAMNADNIELMTHLEMRFNEMDVLLGRFMEIESHIQSTENLATLEETFMMQFRNINDRVNEIRNEAQQINNIVFEQGLDALRNNDVEIDR